MLSKEAQEHFKYLVKEYKVPRNEYDALEIGVFYLYEWKKIASRIANGEIEIIAHDKGQNANRLNPVHRYFQRCWENWESVANSYGITPLGKKRTGLDKKSAKTKTAKNKFRSPPPKVVNI